jgi:hypothetical protein
MLRPVHATGTVALSKPQERLEPRFVLRGHRCTIGAICFIDTQSAKPTDQSQKRSTPTQSQSSDHQQPASDDASASASVNSLVLVSGDEQGVVHLWSLHTCRSIHSFQASQQQHQQLNQSNHQQQNNNTTQSSAAAGGKLLPTILAIQAWRRSDDLDEDDQREQQQQQQQQQQQHHQNQQKKDDASNIDDDEYTIFVQCKDGTINLWSINGLSSYIAPTTLRRKRNSTIATKQHEITSYCRWRISTRAYGFMPVQVHLNLNLPIGAFSEKRSDNSIDKAKHQTTTVALIPTDQPNAVQLIALHSHQSILACDVETSSSCATTKAAPADELMSQIKAEIAAEVAAENQRKAELLQRFNLDKKAQQIQPDSSESSTTQAQVVEAPVYTVPYTGIAQNFDARQYGMVMCAENVVL